jgi:malonyl CoA-acyl carrier protein transacylase
MSRESGGAMAAVIGLSVEQIRQVLTEANLLGIDIANLNSNNQTVISGPEQEIVVSQHSLEKAGAQLFKRLAVSAAFHSRYMVRAQHEFATFLQQISLAEPRIPVVSNVTARPHILSELKAKLASQITHSVRWRESVEWLLEKPEAELVEIGPGNVLTGLVRRIQMERRAAIAEVSSQG